MNMMPIAADDEFSADQGLLTTTISGHLGADNGHGTDSDPDGTLLGWAGPGFTTQGDGDRFLGAFFSNGQLGFLSIAGTLSYPFPVWSTTLVLTTAEGGRVILETNGSFTYTAPAGFSGIDWFEYSLVDGEYGTDIGRVTLTVVDTATGNDRPDAKDDAFNGTEDQQISGNLLADNGSGADSDPNGDALSVVNHTIFTERGGRVSIYANGDFVYTPPANYSGADAFAYTLKDIHGATSTGRVTLNIAAVNDAPIARADTFSGVHDKPISGNVLSNDSDPEGGSLSVTPSSFTTVNGGQVVLLANGTFTYTPAAGYVGGDSFTYTAFDAGGASAVATVSLNIFNTAPRALTDWFTAQYGKGIGGNVLANDSDPDGDPLSVTPGTFATAQGGVVKLNADGSFVYTPGEAFYGTDSFQYSVSDGFGGTATGTVFVNTAAPSGSVYGNADDNSITCTALADYVFAFDGDDTLQGLDGNDMLAGGGDKDTIYGDGGNDKLYGQSGKDVIRGGIGADYLSGGADGDDLYGDGGADKLFGGAGIDKYFGGGGNDQFIFDAANGTSADRVMDFKLGDKLTVRASDYGLALGGLADASYFAAAGAATVGHGRFLYTSATRSLAWDADGNAATANVVIATFDKAVTLSFSDFLVI